MGILTGFILPNIIPIALCALCLIVGYGVGFDAGKRDAMFRWHYRDETKYRKNVK